MKLSRRVVLLTLSLSLGALPACGGAPPQGHVPTDNKLTTFHPPDREDLISSGDNGGWGSPDDSAAADKHAADSAKPSTTATPAKASANKSAKGKASKSHAQAAHGTASH